MKKKMKRFLWTILVGVMIMNVFGIQSMADDGVDYYHGEVEESLIWENNPNAGENKVLNRAPGIVVTKQDTIIVYSENRWPLNKEYSLPDTSADWCLMNIVMKRSTDGGKTFGDNIILAEGTQEYAAVNNPVMIVGNDNTLHFFYCRNYSVYGAGIWYRTSTDDGLTWSEPRDLSEYTATLGYNYNCFAFGPTHGICTSDGILMTGVWLVNENNLLPVTSHGKSTTHLFWSDDNGETWHITPSVFPQTTNETAVAELSDGSILVNSRNPEGYRALNLCMDFKAEGSLTWQGMIYHPELPDANCCGGMISVDLDGLPFGLLNVNCANNTVLMENSTSMYKRTNVTVKCSFDDGQTFEKELRISTDKGGYCDLAVDSQGKVYVIWEENYGTNVHLTTFSYEDVFCSDSYVTNPETAVTFRDEESVSRTSNYKNMSGELRDGVLHVVTESKTTSKGFEVDYSTLTRMIDMEDYPYLLCKIKIDPSTAGDVELEGYIRSGRTTATNAAYGASTTVANDGEWHNVIIDYTGNDIDGTLQNVFLRLGVKDGAKSAIVTADIAGIGLFRTEEEAQAYEFTAADPVQNDTGETQDTANPGESDTQAARETEKGCASALNGTAGVLALGVTAGALTCRKRKTGKKAD